MKNFPNKIVFRICNFVCNDDLSFYKKLMLNKKYKQILENDVVLYNMMYKGINTKNRVVWNLIKKNIGRLKALCIPNLDEFVDFSELKSIEKLIVSHDKNKSTFKYIWKFTNLKKLYVNLGVDDKYMPIITYPNSINSLKICARISTNVKRNIENENEGNERDKNCEKRSFSIYKCGSKTQNNIKICCKTKEDEIFNKICKDMDEKLSRKKRKKNTYEYYEKNMNVGKYLCDFNNINYEESYF